MPSESQNKKNVLRNYYRSLRNTLSPTEKHDLSLRLSELLKSLPLVQRASTILGYAALEDELDLQSFYAWCMDEGKTLCFPRSEEGNHYHFAEITDLNTSSTPGAFGILEPRQSCDRFLEQDATKMSTVMLVPGLAFDNSGQRLGYGKGIYDGLIRAYSAYTIGISAPSCHCETLPRDPWDQQVDLVLSRLDFPT